MLKAGMFPMIVLCSLSCLKSSLAEEIVYESDFTSGESSFEVIESGFGSIVLSTQTVGEEPSLRVYMSQKSSGAIGAEIPLQELPWYYCAHWWRIDLWARADLNEGSSRLVVKCIDTEGEQIDMINLSEIPQSATLQHITAIVGVPKAAPDERTIARRAQLTVRIDNAQGSVWLSNLRITKYEMSESEKTEWNVNGPTDFGGLPWFNEAYSDIRTSDELLADTGDKLLAAVGMTKMRFIVRWGDDREEHLHPAFEKTKGNYEFETVDDLIERSDYYDATIGVMTVEGLPSWSYTWKDLENFVTAMVNHFKDHVDTWEVWNEPDNYMHSGIERYNRFGMNEYCEYLKHFYIAAKSADPSCTVLCGRVANWFPFMLRRGMAQYMDGVCPHPYAGAQSGEEESLTRVIQRTREYQKAMIAGRVRKPIFVSEVGFGAGWPWIGPGGQRSEELKAERIRQVFPKLATLTSSVYWYAPIVSDRKHGVIRPVVDDHDRTNLTFDRYMPLPALYAIGKVSGKLKNDEKSRPIRIKLAMPDGPVAKNTSAKITLAATNTTKHPLEIRFWPVGFVKNLGLDLPKVRSKDWNGTLNPGEVHEVVMTVTPNEEAYGRFPVGLAVISSEGNSLLLKDLWIESIACMSKAKASYCNSDDTVSALNDLIDPVWSYDESVPRHTWYPHRGTEEWVQYDFDQPHTVSGVEVYWVDDTRPHNSFASLPYDMFRVPQSWCVEYKDGDTWEPITEAFSYFTPGDDGRYMNQFNRVTFEPVDTTGLRLVVQLQKDYSAGVFEWRILQ